MKAKAGLPERVRLTEGLGGAVGTAALAFAAKTLAEPEQRDTLSIGVVFTSGSLPELNPIAPLWFDDLAWCFLARERPAEGRAATTRLTPWLLSVPAIALATAVAVLCGTELPARSSAVNSEQVA